MLASTDPWSAAKRNTPYTATDDQEEIMGNSYYASENGRSPIKSPRKDSPFSHLGRRSRSSSTSSSNLIRSFSERIFRSQYVRYVFCILLGLFIGRAVFSSRTSDQAIPGVPALPHRITKTEKPSTSTTTADSSSTYSNSTLGTSAILVLNADSRPDRRDFLTIMSAVSNLKFQYQSVWTKKPVEKALPAEHNPNLNEMEYACWRSHADAWRRVVEEGWETALILEDDVDWDGNIHQSMAIAWEGLKAITKDPSAASQGKSYVASFSNNTMTNLSAFRWDIFYTGVCQDWTAGEHLELKDPYLPKTSTWWIDGIYNAYFGSSATIRRLIQRSVEPVCTHSYIVSQTGARKLLYHTNMFLPWGVDVALIKLINKGTIKSYTIVPPLFVLPFLLVRSG